MHQIMCKLVNVIIEHLTKKLIKGNGKKKPVLCKVLYYTGALPECY